MSRFPPVRSLVAVLSCFLFNAVIPSAGAAPAAAAIPVATPAATAPSARAMRMAEQAFSRGTPLPAWVDRIAALPPAMTGSAVSMRLADTQFRVDAVSTMYARRALVASDAASLGALGQYELEFQPEYQQLALHALRIVRGAQVIDKLASADIRFLQRETSLDQAMYSGSVTAAIVTEDVRVGDTLEMEYSITGQNPVFGGKFVDHATWDSNWPVALRRVSVDMPLARTVHVRLIGAGSGTAPALTTASKDGRRTVRYLGRALPGKLPEPYVPSDIHQYRFLQLSEFDNWHDVNQWALGLFATGDAGADLTAALAPARAAPGKEAAVAKVLEFVQNDIRYLSISLGENSHRPYPPAQVLQRRYGDCKDKSLLMVSMLRELGIEAQPVLVSTSQRKGLEQMMPSPLLFDHVIVRAVVDGKEYYLDPTRQGQYGALARMGQTHGGSQGLTIASATRGLSTIGPLPGLGVLLSARLERVTAGAFDQPVDMQIRSSYEGMYAEYLRLQLASVNKDNLRKIYEGALGDRYPESTLVGEPVVHDDRALNRLVVETNYRITNFFEAQPQGWQLRYIPSNMKEQFYVPGNGRRDHPIVLPNGPGRVEYELALILPAAVDGNYKDALTEHKLGPFDVSETLAFQGRNASVKARLQLNADRVPASGVIDFLAGMKKYNAVLNGGFFIRKTDVAQAPVAAPGPKKSLKAQLEANLLSTSRQVDTAEQAGQDATEPLCERGLLRAWLGQDADALQDGARVVKLQAHAGSAWKCRGDIHFIAGKFAEGESDYGRALSRGSEDSATWLGRALSSLHLGKTVSARQDLAQARDKSADQAARQQVAVWLAIVDWQAGAAPAESAADTESQEWRQAAQAMFAQGRAPEQMLRLASRATGVGSDVRLTEAYFYAGKYYQLRKDKLRARVYFKQALDKGVLDNLYHTAARHDLARVLH